MPGNCGENEEESWRIEMKMGHKRRYGKAIGKSSLFLDVSRRRKTEKRKGMRKGKREDGGVQLLALI